MGNTAVRVLLCAAAVTGLLAAAPAASAAAAASPAAARTYANENDGCSCREQTIEAYRPSGRFYIARGGPDLWASAGIRWQYWSTTARGTASLVAADARQWSVGHVTLDFYDRTYSQTYREWYFEKLHIIGGSGIAHYWHWSWAAQEWEG